MSTIQAPEFTQEQYKQALKGVVGKAYTMGANRSGIDLRSLCEDSLQIALNDYYKNKTYLRDFQNNGVSADGEIEIALLVESAKNRMVNILKRETGENRKKEKAITIDIPKVHHDNYFDHILVSENYKSNDGIYKIMEAVRSLQSEKMIESKRGKKREVAKIKRGHEAAQVVGMLLNGFTEKEIFEQLGKKVEFPRIMKVIKDRIDVMEKIK